MAQKTSWTGAALTQSDINLYLMGEGGAWTSWTPTVSQGVAVTVTNTRSRYARYGRRIEFSTKLTVTSAGTAGSAIAVSIPVTAAASEMVIGTGFIYDGSANLPGIAYLSTTAAVVLLPTWDNISTGFVGTVAGGGSFALANTDTITIFGSYEAAS